MNDASVENKRYEPLIRKLEAAATLSQDDQATVLALCDDVRIIRRHRDIVSEGKAPDRVHIVLEGWAARYAVLANGSRRITAFLLPGDFCDIHITAMAVMDHSIVAITDCSVAFVRKDQIDAVPQSSPTLLTALWRSTLIDESILRQWLVNAGRKTAVEGVAHLLCELHARLKAIGHADETTANLPLTQEDIADATGLTHVHVNRMLRELRERDLLTLAGGVLRLLDTKALAKFSDFDPRYLHLKKPALS